MCVAMGVRICVWVLQYADVPPLRRVAAICVPWL